MACRPQVTKCVVIREMVLSSKVKSERWVEGKAAVNYGMMYCLQITKSVVIREVVPMGSMVKSERWVGGRAAVKYAWNDVSFADR